MTSLEARTDAAAETHDRRVASTTPYAWPYDGRLDAARLALVVCGHDAAWADRCIEAAPDRSTPTRDRVAHALDRLAARLLDLGVLVLRVRHRPDDQGAPPPPGRLAGDPRVTVTTAAGIDGFYGSQLDHRLRRAGTDQLLLGGFGLEGPVHSTMRSANDRGYECLLLRDAAAPVDAALAPSALHMVEMSGGIFGAVGTATDVLAAMGDPLIVRGEESFP
jgi:biuret amidohydrolase